MKVLIVRIGALGDVLHALPAVAALRKARPDWQIDWAVDERWGALLASQDRRPSSGPVTDAVFPLPIRAWKRFPLSSALLRSIYALYRLRRQGYDIVVDMQGTLRSAAVGRLVGGQHLAGYADPRESPAALFYRRRFIRRGTHVVEQGAALLGAACGVDLVSAFADLPTDEDAERWASEHLANLGAPARIAVLAPSAGWPAKQWPARSFAALAQALQQSGWTVLVNNPGGAEPAAMEVLAEVAQAAGAAQPRPELCAITPVNCGIAQFTALLRRVALVVGGDSGPVHLAAALGTPLVALFGPTDPARNGPWGPGAKRVLRHPDSVTSYRHVAQPDAGLTQLRLDDVLQAVQAVQHNGESRLRE